MPDHGKHPVMVKEVQRDTLVPSRVLHVDFHQIRLDRPVRAAVRIQLGGEAAGVKEGGVLQTVLEEIEVKAMPKDLPPVIEADISGLGIGDKFDRCGFAFAAGRGRFNRPGYRCRHGAAGQEIGGGGSGGAGGG